MWSIIYPYLTQVAGSTKTPSDPFLRRLGSLLQPLDGWGSFRRGARRAAVTAVLYKRGGEWHLPFVARSPDLPSHPGQVALPGGGVQAGEDGWSAAAREVEEEVGVAASSLVPLGAGSPIYAAVTNFSVVPFVAWLDDASEINFVHDARELVGVLEVPLARLLSEEEWLEPEEAWMGRYFPWEEDRIWGLTARILGDLLPRFSAALRSSAG